MAIELAGLGLRISPYPYPLQVRPCFSLTPKEDRDPQLSVSESTPRNTNCLLRSLPLTTDSSAISLIFHSKGIICMWLQLPPLAEDVFPGSLPDPLPGPEDWSSSLRALTRPALSLRACRCCSPHLLLGVAILFSEDLRSIFSM